MVVVLVSDSKVILSFCGSLSLNVAEVGISIEHHPRPLMR